MLVEKLDEWGSRATVVRRGKGEGEEADFTTMTIGWVEFKGGSGHWKKKICMCANSRYQTTLQLLANLNEYTCTTGARIFNIW